MINSCSHIFVLFRLRFQSGLITLCVIINNILFDNLVAIFDTLLTFHWLARYIHHRTKKMSPIKYLFNAFRRWTPMNSVSACAHHVQCAETDIIIDWAKPTRERKKPSMPSMGYRIANSVLGRMNHSCVFSNHRMIPFIINRIRRRKKELRKH